LAWRCIRGAIDLSVAGMPAEIRATLLTHVQSVGGDDKLGRHTPALTLGDANKGC